MKRYIFTLSTIFVIIFSLLVLNTFQLDNSVMGYTFPSDDEFKLKFVNASDVEELSNASYSLYTNDYYEVYEENDFICFVVDENKILLSPLDANVARYNDRVELVSGKLKIEVYGLKVICVKDGSTVKKKQAIGSVNGTVFKVRVYYGDRKLNLNTIKRFL